MEEIKLKMERLSTEGSEVVYLVQYLDGGYWKNLFDLGGFSQGFLRKYFPLVDTYDVRIDDIPFDKNLVSAVRFDFMTYSVDDVVKEVLKAIERVHTLQKCRTVFLPREEIVFIYGGYSHD